MDRIKPIGIRASSALAVLLALAGCLGQSPTPARPPPDSAGTPTDPGASPGEAPPASITASQDGLTLAVMLDRSVVEPGGRIVMMVSVRNDRSTPSIVGFGMCGIPATISGDLAVPWEPLGKDWDAIAGEFKRYATQEGFGPGGVRANAAVTVYSRTDPCPQEPEERKLAPGESASVLSTWTAQIVPGVPALPGDVPIHVDVAYDRPDPLPPPVCNPFCGLRTVPWKSMAAEGLVRVEGNPPRLVSAGQAVDALLADERFASWLPLQPSTTWSNANLFLQSLPAAAGIVPAGPTWEIDLFREVGVPRNWAIGYVDAFTGQLRNLAFCNDPCDR